MLTIREQVDVVEYIEREAKIMDTLYNHFYEEVKRDKPWAITVEAIRRFLKKHPEEKDSGIGDIVDRIRKKK